MPVAELEPEGHKAPAAGGAVEPFVLLDDSLSRPARAHLFEDPVEIVCCDEPADAEAALARIAAGLSAGLTAAGFFSYELGYLFEPRLAPLLPAERQHPLLWTGLFRTGHALDEAGVRAYLARHATDGHRLSALTLSQSREAYLAAVRRVQDYIAAGDVYQINYTFKYLFALAGDPLSLYAELRRKQRVAHGAFVRTPERDILSLSPELFLEVEGRTIGAMPMKGTAARGPTVAADAAARAWLRGDEKSRAENLMIVDLLRNDLGRVAEIGSVAVPALFTVETYPTVHQMTSRVTARLRPGVGLRELLASLFPCGSITGAPKVRAMEIIRELEPAARGVYTGAIGMIAPHGDLALNVAIRTLAIDRAGRGEMGIGSGIVADSVPADEYEECLLKARFLTDPYRPFSLLETLRWAPDTGYVLLDRHLTRLAASAAYFARPCDRDAVRGALERAAADFDAIPMRVRLLLDEDGGLDIAAAALPPQPSAAPLRYRISDRRVDRGDPFFYHKTTRRDLYDSEYARHTASSQCDEVLFLNDRDELTEGSRTNLFIERGGVLLTPPVGCGLLDGTLRRDLLEDPRREVREEVLRRADLADADTVYLGNSVRGLLPAVPARETD